MKPSDIISIIALLISVGGFVFVCLNFNIARKANIRAEKADKRAKAADKRAIKADRRAIAATQKAEEQERRQLWNRPIEALGSLVTSHALEEETPERLAESRKALMSLADELSEEDYPGIGEYLAITHGITAKHYEISLLSMRGKPEIATTISEAHDPVVKWLSDAISNLRLLRNSDQTEELKSSLAGSLKNYREVYLQMTGNKYVPDDQKVNQD